MTETLILFGGIIATLTIVALCFVLPPLLRAPRDTGITARHLDIALYREQQLEIEAALGEARITLEQAQQLRQELDLRLLDDAGDDESRPRWQDRGSAWLAGLVSVMLLVGGSGYLYYELGAWQSLEARDLSGEELVRRLAEEMQKRPDALEGWMLLAGSYRRLGEFGKAADAYAELNSRQPAAETLIAEAEMRAASANGSWEGAPEQLLRQALQLNPNHGPALWYDGTLKFSNSEWIAALQSWERLSRLQLPDDFRAVVEERQKQALANYRQQPGALVIPVEVDIEVSLQDQIGEGAVLYLVARAHSSEGAAGGVPLAVIRQPASDFPILLELHDGRAMFAEQPLSGADAWQLVARVSASGDAIPQSGDLEGNVIIEKERLNGPVRLTIDRQRP